MFSSLVVEFLSKGNNEDGVACLYCDYRDQEDQTPANMISGILKQLILTPGQVVPKQITTAFRRRSGQLDLGNACHFLGLVMRCLRRSYICIDALDECKDEHRGVLLQSLRGAIQRSGHKTRLFLTGRPHVESDVDRYLQVQSPAIIEIVASHQDIMKYIAHRIEEDNNPVFMDDGFKQEIITTIAMASQGM